MNRQSVEMSPSLRACYLLLLPIGMTSKESCVFDVFERRTEFISLSANFFHPKSSHYLSTKQQHRSCGQRKPASPVHPLIIIFSFGKRPIRWGRPLSSAWVTRTQSYLAGAGGCAQKIATVP